MMIYLSRRGRVKVNIKGRDYKVILKQELFGDEGQHLSGCSWFKLKKIELVRDDVTKEETIMTIIHELTHCYLYECGTDNLDEDIPIWLEVNFLQILQSLLEIIQMVFPEDLVNVQKIIKILNKWRVE